MLEKINMPSDLKKLSIEELNTLSDEIRAVLIKKVDATGGHMGSNLGMIEPTIALHYVFDSPIDKIIYDVSHQSYTHKILTGRKEAFIDPEKYYSISGYTNPLESEHDFFTIGHTSTSISLATGLAKGRDLKGEKGNVIAVIGDGSLSGGEAFEGLNNASVLNSNIIILVNDNDMSIAENHGGIYKNLKLLRETKGMSETNFFKTFGFDYYFIEDGNNIEKMIELLKKVKDTNKPTIIHMCTLKGKGLKDAEVNKEKWHWTLPNRVNVKEEIPFKESYVSLTNEYLEKKYKEGKSLVVITAGTPGATGLTKEWREKAGKNYTDVGIAEGHAVAYSSGIAKAGAKPVFQVFSSFIQRTYDQLSHDLALNNNPAVILVYAGGIFGGKGGVSGGDATHLGSFDISMISNIPNLVYLAPTYKEEYLKVLEWAIEQNEYPVVIRVPYLPPISKEKDENDYSKINRYKLVEKGEKVAILALGTFFNLGEKVKKLLKEKVDINATLINPLYITGMDKDLLENLKENHKVVITLEDGILNGGFGEKIASYYGNSDMKVLNFGAKKEFTDRISIEELYNRYKLNDTQIVEEILKVMK